MWDELKNIFTGPVGPWICLLGLVVISLLWLQGERLLYTPIALCLGFANRRETLRFCYIGSIHVDPGSLCRYLLRNAAPGDLETALDRRFQKRAVMLGR